MAEASRTIELIFSAVDNATETTREIGKGITEFGEGLDKAGEKAIKMAEPLAHLSELILGVVEASQAAGAALISFAIKSAAEFEESFALISTKIKDGSVDLGAFKQAVLDYASSSSAKFTEVTSSVQIVVEKLHDQKNAIDLVSKAEELGDATGNNLVDTTKLLVTSLLDYGKGANEATHFSDVLFTAARDGGGDFAGLSDTIGKIGPLAKQAGLSFEDTAAALATMGARGIDSGTAASALTRILTALADPTKQVRDEAQRLGLDFSTSAVQAKGFGGFLQDLATKTNGNIDNFKSLGISARGLNAAIALTADSGKAFATELDAITNSAGNTSKGYEKMAHQISQDTQALLNSIQGAATQIGLPLVAAFLRVEEAAAKVFLAIKEGAQAGAFQELQRVVNDTLDEITAALTKVAANLPKALEGLDFKPLIAELEIAKEHFATLFEGLDLSSPEGLHAALQKLINLGGDLVAFHNGVVTAFTTIFGPIFKVGELVAGQGQSWAKLAGEIGGTAIAITLFAPILSAVGSAITIGGLAIRAGAATFEFLAAAVEASNLALAGNPIALALLGTALIASTFYHKELGQAITNLVPKFTELVTGSSAAAAELEKLSVIQKQLSDSVKDSGVHISDFIGMTGALVGAVRTGGAETEILSHHYETLNGVLQLVINSNTDYVAQAHLVIDKTKELHDPVKQAGEAIANFFGQFGESTPLFKTFGDNIDLAAEGFRVVQVATHDADGNITGFTEALTFAGIAAKDATDKTVTGLSKIQQEALKAQQEANKFNLEWEKIQSQDRQVVFKLSADIQLAQIQAGTEQIKAAFESVNTTVKSTGDTIAALVHDLANVGTQGVAGQEIIHLLGEENKRRQEALDLQKGLVSAQIAYLNAVVDRLSNGDAFISVTADGLEPELEAFMFKILERIQVRASSEAQQFLLGLQ